MNETSIPARDLVAGDFVVLGSRVIKVADVLQEETGMQLILADGQELPVEPDTKFTVLDDEEDDVSYSNRGGDGYEHF